MQKKIWMIAGLMTLVLAFGCDKSTLKTYPVSGKVTYKGQPVVAASVFFNPKVQDQGHDAYAITDGNGVYKLQTQLGKAEGGTTPGEYYVRVGKTEDRPTGKSFVDSSGVRTEETLPVQVLPAKYGDATQTPLSFTVEKKRNTYDIVIED
jgi:hypothetical protein